MGEYESFGRAKYVDSRYARNKVLFYVSQKHRNRCYQFNIAKRFKIPGYISWSCIGCQKKKKKLNMKDYKVPVILVAHDIILEDPDHPPNAQHFCGGDDPTTAVMYRVKMEVLKEAASDSDKSTDELLNKLIELPDEPKYSFLSSKKRSLVKQVFMHQQNEIGKTVKRIKRSKAIDDANMTTVERARARIRRAGLGPVIEGEELLRTGTPVDLRPIPLEDPLAELEMAGEDVIQATSSDVIIQEEEEPPTTHFEQYYETTISMPDELGEWSGCQIAQYSQPHEELFYLPSESDILDMGSELQFD